MSYAAVLERPDIDEESSWQVVDRRPLYVRAQRSNYYTRTVHLEPDLDPRHLRMVRFEPAPPEEFDF